MAVNSSKKLPVADKNCTKTQICGTCVPLKIQQYKIRQNEQQKHASFNLAWSFGILTQNSKRFRTEVIILNMIVLYCRRCLLTPLAEMEINLLCHYLLGVTKKDDLKPKLDALHLIFRPPNVFGGLKISMLLPMVTGIRFYSS